MSRLVLKPIGSKDSVHNAENLGVKQRSCVRIYSPVLVLSVSRGGIYAPVDAIENWITHVVIFGESIILGEPDIGNSIQVTFGSMRNIKEECEACELCCFWSIRSTLILIISPVLFLVLSIMSVITSLFLRRNIIRRHDHSVVCEL